MIIDTTVQEKAISYQTDAGLYCKAIRRLAKLAKRQDMNLRQSYVCVSKRAFLRQDQYARVDQYKRAAKHTRKLKKYLGHLIRNIKRKMINFNNELSAMLDHARLIYPQQLKDKGKLYSLDAPEVDSRIFVCADKNHSIFSKRNIQNTTILAGTLSDPGRLEHKTLFFRDN